MANDELELHHGKILIEALEEIRDAEASDFDEKLMKANALKDIAAEVRNWVTRHSRYDD